MPHIVIIVENMPVPADRRVWQEANSLKQHGYDVSVICPKTDKYNDSFEQINGIDIYRHPLPFEANSMAGYVLEYGTALFFEAWLLCRIGLRKIDVVQICNPPDFLFIPAMLAKVFGGAKIIFDHHDLAPELLVEKTGKTKGFLHWVTKWAEKLTFKVADKVISTNEGFRQIAIDRGNMAPEDVRVVYSAPNMANVKYVEADHSLKKGKSKLLMWVGMIGSQDGVDLLLQAVKEVIDQGTDDFHLAIVGDGPERENLVNLAEDLQISDYITFTGFLSGEELNRYFCSADIGVGSDPKNDFNDKLAMNKVMEYMAYCLPMAIFDLTECKNIAGASAITAHDNDPKDLARAISVLLEDEMRGYEMGKFGLNRLREHYSWDIQAQNLIGLYTDLLSEDKSKTATEQVQSSQSKVTV